MLVDVLTIVPTLIHHDTFFFFFFLCCAKKYIQTVVTCSAVSYWVFIYLTWMYCSYPAFSWAGSCAIYIDFFCDSVPSIAFRDMVFWVKNHARHWITFSFSWTFLTSIWIDTQIKMLSIWKWLYSATWTLFKLLFDRYIITITLFNLLLFFFLAWGWVGLRIRSYSACIKFFLIDACSDAFIDICMSDFLLKFESL